MPYRKKYKYKRKRPYKKRRRNKRKMSKMSVLKLKNPSLMPDVVFVKLKYVDTITMTSILGLGNWVFAMNSLFDTDVTGGGHQPLGYDQWSSFYNSYEVLGSSIKTQLLASDVNVAGFALYPSFTITPVVGYSNAREQPYSKSTWIVNSTSSIGTKLSQYMSIKKFEGRSTDSVNFVASTGANPVSRRYWILTLQSQTGTDISDIVIDVKMTYYCRFFRRIQLSQS